MSISYVELLLYAGGLFILFLTPGPVWVALTARAISGGFNAAWPLALGVVVGDVLWPLFALFGVALLVELYAEILIILRVGGALILMAMGVSLIRNADRGIATEAGLTRPGMLAGFLAGVMVILGNPKAILFYMGILPGFFDLTSLNGWDMAAICTASALVPFIGNVALALLLHKVRRFLSSPVAVRRTNIGSGIALIIVGGFIAHSAF